MHAVEASTIENHEVTSIKKMKLQIPASPLSTILPPPFPPLDTHICPLCTSYDWPIIGIYPAIFVWFEYKAAEDLMYNPIPFIINLFLYFGSLRIKSRP